MKFSLTSAFIVFMVTSFAHAATTEIQTINKGINGSTGWVASYGTASEQVRSDNGYLSIAGRGGAGQYFLVNGKSKYQIATATALKASNWGAIGVTYYDSNWNEVHVVRKEVTDDLRFGGQESRYAIGIVPPSNAAFGFLWVWNDDVNGYTQVDNFELLNYFPSGDATFDGSQPVGDQYTQTFPDGRNLLVNGDFETSEFEGDEFWNVLEIDDSVYWQTQPYLGGTNGLHVGSPFGVNLISQVTTELVGGSAYSMVFTGGRNSYAGSGSPWAIVGVDYYDGNWNKLDSDSTAITNFYDVGKFPRSNDTILQLQPPVGTVNSVVWVWVEAGDSPLWVRRIKVSEADLEPPVVDVTSVRAFGAGRAFDARFSDNTAVDNSTLDSNDFKVIGPNGEERSVAYNPPRPFQYPDYSIEGVFDAAENGTWRVIYNPGEIADIFGNAAQRPSPGATDQVVATFEINEN